MLQSVAECYRVLSSVVESCRVIDAYWLDANEARGAVVELVECNGLHADILPRVGLLHNTELCMAEVSTCIAIIITLEIVSSLSVAIPV